MSDASLLIGIFVGGHSKRMGGVPKGTLPAPDEAGSLVQRLVRISNEASGGEPPVLVGDAGAYRDLGLLEIADEPAGIGPLGGLLALLGYAKSHGKTRVVALACDLPFVTAPLLERLLEHARKAAAVAPRLDGRWQPLCARYAPEPVLAAAHATLANGERALQRVFQRLGPHASALPLEAQDSELLRDWDRPEDIGSEKRGR
jgi:molybdenum cofactor guanylyltransferase